MIEYISDSKATELALFLKSKAQTMEELAEWLGMTKMTLYKRFREENWLKGDKALIENMVEYFRSNNNIHVSDEIPPPGSQVQEVLYELITRRVINRKLMMNENDINNLPARIMDLRMKYGKSFIKSNEYTGINKYGREVDFCDYEISDRDQAIEKYIELVSKN